jgi:hypothetical protein
VKSALLILGPEAAPKKGGSLSVQLLKKVEKLYPEKSSQIFDE